jgi:hypothetical protein
MQGDRQQSGGTTANASAKFAIGVLAGVAAVLLPRLLALLSKSDDAQIVFFPFSYYLLALGVGLFVGAVMLVIEYEVPATPKETFMAALGIPAVLSGALGTASTAETVSDLARDAERLRQAMRLEQGIVKDGAITIIEPVVRPERGADPRVGPRIDHRSDEHSLLWLPFIATAHASDLRAPQPSAPSDPVRFGVRVEQPKYVVVLKQASSEAQALKEAEKLKADLPGARAVRSSRGYVVILGNGPTNETDALLAAARAKKMHAELQPVLFEVRTAR